jgi:orotidine-5'-phosphate decarboxylase
MTFTARLAAAWQKNDSLLCAGLDPDPARFPLPGLPIFDFCRAIADAVASEVCAFKPQIAYFAANRAEHALERLVAYLHEKHPGIPVVLDAKRGDIGATAAQYAREAFVRYGADAVTINPYMGRDSIEPYLEYAGKGVVLLCRTSNAGGDDLQGLAVGKGDEKLYEHVARLAADWNAGGQLALVVGATYPKELARVRAIVGGMPLLVPGIGAQGGDIQATVEAGQNAAGTGLMVSSSRAILYAGQGKDFALAAQQAARETKEAINRFRTRP